MNFPKSLIRFAPAMLAGAILLPGCGTVVQQSYRDSSAEVGGPPLPPYSGETKV